MSSMFKIKRFNILLRTVLKVLGILREQHCRGRTTTDSFDVIYYLPLHLFPYILLSFNTNYCLLKSTTSRYSSLYVYVGENPWHLNIFLSRTRTAKQFYFWTTERSNFFRQPAHSDFHRIWIYNSSKLLIFRKGIRSILEWCSESTRRMNHEIWNSVILTVRHLPF